MSAQPVKGRWLVVQRIATGTRRLAVGLGRWLAAVDLKGWARARGVLGRITGTGGLAWFLGGMGWALGTPPWAVVPLWLGTALAASYRDQRDAAEQPEEIAPAVFLELLHDLAGGANLHLVTVREQLAEETGRPWSGPEARALCVAARVPVRDGVRVPGARPAVTTGIHKDDLPPLPCPSPAAPVGVVGAGQDHNNNTNTNTTVEEIGQAGILIKSGPSRRQGVS